MQDPHTKIEVFDLGGATPEVRRTAFYRVRPVEFFKYENSNLKIKVALLFWFVISIEILNKKQVFDFAIKWGGIFKDVPRAEIPR